MNALYKYASKALTGKEYDSYVGHYNSASKRILASPLVGLGTAALTKGIISDESWQPALAAGALAGGLTLFSGVDEIRKAHTLDSQVQNPALAAYGPAVAGIAGSIAFPGKFVGPVAAAAASAALGNGTSDTARKMQKNSPWYAGLVAGYK